MNFTTAIGTCFAKYGDFSGRARRSEFWWWALFVWTGSMLLAFVDATLFGTVETGPGFFLASTDRPYLSGAFSLAILVPNLAVAVRRLHDTDRSGWWLLIGLVPVVGLIVLIVFLATEGTNGANRFGADPLGGDGDGGGDGEEDDVAASNIPRVPRS